MTTKTYFAKLDCFHNTVNRDHMAGEAFKSFCDFMTYVSASNRATLITWNSGSSASAGSFESRTYWDGSRPFGRGAHAVWRINAFGERNWDWYLYAQVVSGSAAIANETFNQPIVNFASANFMTVTNYRGVAIQIAACFSGSTSFNPWNGTISQGNSTASNPRWNSGSSDRILYVLPRSNDLGGTHAASRNNSVDLVNNITTSTNLRHHMIFDGDAIFTCFTLNDAQNSHAIRYFGPFEMRSSLSGSGIAGSQMGLTMLREDGTSGDIVVTNTVIGDTAGSSSRNGGVAVPINQFVSGSKTSILYFGSALPFIQSSQQPNFYTEKYDEFSINLGVSEAPDFGLLGQMNYGLIRSTIGPISYDSNIDLSRMIIAGNSAVSGDYVVSIPWTGSLGPGSSLARTGSNFTWTKDYR